MTLNEWTALIIASTALLIFALVSNYVGRCNRQRIEAEAEAFADSFRRQIQASNEAIDAMFGIYSPPAFSHPADEVPPPNPKETP